MLVKITRYTEGYKQTASYMYLVFLGGGCIHAMMTIQVLGLHMGGGGGGGGDFPPSPKNNKHDIVALVNYTIMRIIILAENA